MDALKEKFEKMGARVRETALSERAVRRLQRRRWRGGPDLAAMDDEMPVRLDVQRDGYGEYFELRRHDDVAVEVVDVDAGGRHLLLRVRRRRDNQRTTGDASEGTFLCGHDERSWFVAAIPERARAGSVQDAKDALKPA